MSDVKSWVEESAYTKKLGVEAKSITEEGSELFLPFREGNSNPGGALHGGVYASMSLTSAHAAARTALGTDLGPFHTVSFQINYLSAAISEGVTAKARLMRRGKELAFVEVSCVSDAGVEVSHATIMIRGRAAAEDVTVPQLTSEVVGNLPSEEAGMVTAFVPFINERGISVDHLENGEARLSMPWNEDHADAATGGTHEGAVLALLDTAGSMAGWAIVGGIGQHKASTPSMHCQVLADAPKQDLVAHAKVSFQDNEIFYCDVEVVGKDDNKIYARGTVFYRIVVKKKK